jgi:hypothetical protein
LSFIKKAKGNEPLAYIILYVDDGVIFGTPKNIEQVMKSISSILKVKDLDSFSQYINTDRKFHTTGAPNTVVMRPKKGDNVLSPKDQTKYCSGVSMFFYLVKH